MKPLLVSHSDVVGGAGRAAYRLHSALQRSGFDSSMMVRQKHSNDQTVICSHSVFAKLAELIRSQFEHRLQRLGGSEKVGFVSLNLCPTRWSRTINSFGADIVNLHWFGSGALSIRDVSRINRPVVMTLHDMWAFCGTEHYAPDSGDARWRTGYGRRYQQDDHQRVDIGRLAWRSKRRHWHPFPIVCPSSWLAECVRSSALMDGWPVHVVPNVLDVELFRPRENERSREALDLPQEQKVILFGAAAGSTDKRKGFDLLVEALDRYGSNGGKATGVIFGQSEPEQAPELNVPLRWMGAIDNDRTLSQLYSAADVMVVPSRQEAFGQTASEAQACGTPVVAFNATGLRDVVVHEKTGYLATAFAPDDLARGIGWILEDESRRQEMGRVARQRSVDLWSSLVVADQYRSVFESAIEDYACGHRGRGT